MNMFDIQLLYWVLSRSNYRYDLNDWLIKNKNDLNDTKSILRELGHHAPIPSHGVTIFRHGTLIPSSEKWQVTQSLQYTTLRKMNAFNWRLWSWHELKQYHYIVGLTPKRRAYAQSSGHMHFGHREVIFINVAKKLHIYNISLIICSRSFE